MSVARRFVVLGHTQKPLAPIPLNDPCGAGGRWDVLARCATNALLVSHGARRDTEVVLALRGPEPWRTVRVEGASIRFLNPDERSTLALVSKALEATDVGEHESTPHPGIHVSRRPFAGLLDAWARSGPLYWLRETEADAFDAPSNPGPHTFVLSDHQDPTAEERELLENSGALPVHLGPVSLQADQCISIVHNRLDVAARPSPSS